MLKFKKRETYIKISVIDNSILIYIYQKINIF